MWGWRLGYGQYWKSGLTSYVVAALAAFVAAGAALSAATPTAQAQSGGRLWESEKNRGGLLVVTLNKSRTIRMLQPFSNVINAGPDIAHVEAIPDRSLLHISGAKVGTTSLSVFDENQRLIDVIDVEVAVDIETLRQKIVATTHSRGIRVFSSYGRIVLSGQANDAVAADQAVQIAGVFVPGTTVVNAMTVANSQQVLIKVRFLEVDRNAGRQLGVNWFAGNSAGTNGINTGQGSISPAGTNNTGGLIPGPLAMPTTTNYGGFIPAPLTSIAGTLPATIASPFGSVLANLVNRGVSIDVLVTALETQGSVRKLAEPNLMALSGDTAKFNVGGSTPMPTISSTSTGQVTPSITQEEFGVSVSFTPTVLANGLINLHIYPRVKEIDPASGITISGVTVPGFSDNFADTTVELRSGQSFAIAGLLIATDTRNINQIPWIGSVPVLGTLFSSKGLQKAETDLVIIVTPNLVKPAVPGQRLATPLDDRLNGNDKDFFLMGQSEVKKDYSGFVASGGGVQGPYGHLIPSAPRSSDPGAGR